MREQIHQRSLFERFQPRSSDGPHRAIPLIGWNGPTLTEFVRQIEHEFGRGVDVSALRLAGLTRNEHLDPDAIRSLCDLLGLPPEDFGVS
ncbi:MAG: hypothetical protein OEM62_03605 [Acidobacteriota bacterium]|nr:hypothetical protein [Acidobacteriota bacterium]